MVIFEIDFRFLLLLIIRYISFAPWIIPKNKTRTKKNPNRNISGKSSLRIIEKMDEIIINVNILLPET